MSEATSETPVTDLLEERLRKLWKSARRQPSSGRDRHYGGVRMNPLDVDALEREADVRLRYDASGQLYYDSVRVHRDASVPRGRVRYGPPRRAS